MQKLYCDVDETGQDTRGTLFIVSVVITEDDRQELANLLARIEKRSGKGKVKWIKAADNKRSAYIRAILRTPAFKGTLYYSLFRQHLIDYAGLTLQTTASGILQVTHNHPEHTKSTIIIDGLPKSEYSRFGTLLRKRWRIRTEKVRGSTEEANIFIRLADALCGFLRQAEEGRKDFVHLRDTATKEGYLTRVGET